MAILQTLLMIHGELVIDCAKVVATLRDHQMVMDNLQRINADQNLQQQFPSMTTSVKYRT